MSISRRENVYIYTGSGDITVVSRCRIYTRKLASPWIPTHTDIDLFPVYRDTCQFHRLPNQMRRFTFAPLPKIFFPGIAESRTGDMPDFVVVSSNSFWKYEIFCRASFVSRCGYRYFSRIFDYTRWWWPGHYSWSITDYTRWWWPGHYSWSITDYTRWWWPGHYSWSITDYTRSITDYTRSITDYTRSITDYTRSITDYTRSITDYTRSITDYTRSITDYTRWWWPGHYSWSITDFLSQYLAQSWPFQF